MEIFTNFICNWKKIIGDDDIDDLLNKLNNPTLKNFKKETDDMMNMIENLSKLEQNPDSKKAQMNKEKI